MKPINIYGRMFTMHALVAIVTLLTFSMPACAHDGAKTAADVPAKTKKSSTQSKQDISALDEVALGLYDFEKRAKSYNSDEWNFVLGYAHYMHGKWQESEHYLKAAAQKLTTLDDYILFYRARIANELGQFSDALSYIDKLQTLYPESVWIQQAKVQKAVSLAGLDKFSEALDLLFSVREQASEEMKTDIERLIAKTYIKANEANKAIEYVKSMALAQGSERDLNDISDLFDEIHRRYKVNIHDWLETPENQLILAESFAADSQWQDAAARLNKLLDYRDLSSAMKIRAKWLLAKSYRWTHRYDESIAIMEELKKSPAGQGIPDLSATMATVYAKKNDYDKAIAIRTRMFERLPPASAAAADIAFKIAFLHVDENKYEEAIPLWRQVASKNSAGRNKILAHWYIGWCYYKLKDYDAALAEFDDLLKGAAKAAKIPDRVIYWKGRTLLALGRGDEAASSFREVIEKYPRGYYAELAKRRLKGDVRGVRDFAHARETWKSESDWMPRDPSAVSGIPHMRRALELDKLGLHEEVGREIRSMNNSMSAEAAEVALWLACKNFAHDVAYQLAQHTFKDILRNLPESRFDRFVWEQSYPKAYDPIVARANSKGDLDSKLVWSIMRNESNFRPHVVSPAGAVGLMQLMPTTAGIVAKDLGEEKISVKDLHKPGTNIAYGITYLEQLSKMFPENEVAVIASYNAGEQAVDRWLKNGSFNDIEEWIEEIPYSETNLYVKKVLNSYWDYQKLYGQQRKQSRQGKQRVIGM